MLAEIYGKATGCCKGMGGSMHLIDLSVNVLGTTPIVGSIIPIAVGAAFSAWMKNEKKVTVIFLGRAATEEGVFFESLNFAALKKLPILFVSEDNLFSVYSPLADRQPKERDNLSLAKSFGIAGTRGDGNNIETVYDLTRKGVEHIKRGDGPYFLEFETYRWREHCGPGYDNDLGYRNPDEFEEWHQRCPVENFEKKMLDASLIEKTQINQMRCDIQEEVESAFEFAKSSPFPNASQAFSNIYA
jgi:pyruvate dehydrogenase E1 component alpha subunit